MRYLNLLWNLYQLKRNTGKTREQIRQLQKKKLQRILEHAFDNSPFYRRQFERNGIGREQIGKLPLSAFPSIDKAAFLEHFDELVTVPGLTQQELRRFDEEETMEKKTFRDRYHVVHSSGSTGTPGYFVYDESAWEQMLVGIIRAALWNMTMPEIMKFLIGKPRIMYIAATDGRYGGAMAVGSGIEGVKANQLFLDVKTPLPEWVEQIKSFRPNMVIGYPSALKILGELAESGAVQLDVMRVVSCGEPLGASMRHYIETVFKADVVNIYGASESLSLGVEINEAEGMHLFDDMNYIEVEDGSMYLTSLYNYIQPLIRYKISDQLMLKADEKRSAYPFTRVENILGRQEDLMWFCDHQGNRDFLHPLVIEGFCVEGLLDYQFRQLDERKFEMLTEVSDENKKERVQSEMHREMKKILREKQLEFVEFYIRFVEKILPDPQTGKKTLIVK